MEDVEKFAVDAKDSTIVEHQITTDATFDTAYHWFEDCIEQVKEGERYRVLLQWSPDSKHFATVRSNTSMLIDFWVINILKKRPELFTYSIRCLASRAPTSGSSCSIQRSLSVARWTWKSIRSRWYLSVASHILTPIDMSVQYVLLG